MAVKSRDVLKTYFENGDKPNEQQFSDLIDSLIHVNEGGGTNTNDGPTGTGIVDGITTDEDGNLVFTFVGGDTINITTNGSVGTVKMPIPYVDSYDNFYFVSEEKGDDDKAIPNSYRFYKSIVAASEAARADYDKTGNKNMVYVFKGTYNEESVNRNHVDMYFEDGAVIWVDGYITSVIDDKLEAITNANIYGKGTFVNLTYDPYDDREGINFRQASSLYIEAKLIDGFQHFKNDITDVTLANMDILFGYATWHNKKIKFKNCRFLNGLKFPNFRNENGSQIFENCEFICPPYLSTDPKNKSFDIKNYKGEDLFRVISYAHKREKVEDRPPILLDPNGKTSETILKNVYEVRASGRVSPNPEVSCIAYIENDLKDHSNYNGKIEIRNSKFIIQKDNCFGAILLTRKNSTRGFGHILLDNIIIIDETTTKKSTALVTGWGDQATQQPELMINALSHNCETDHKLLAPNLNKWDITFNSIGDYVSKKNGGVFEGNLSVTDNENLNHYPGIYMATDGSFSTSHKIPRAAGIGGGLSIKPNEKEGTVSFQFRAKPDDYKDDQTLQIGYYKDSNLFKNAVNSMQMFQSNSLFVIGGWLGLKGSGAGYKEGDKFRILNGNAEIDGALRVKKIHSTSELLTIQTPTGHANLGSANANWFHFSTDRPNFYFNKGVHANGDIRLYQKDTYMRHSDGAIFENGVRVATQTWVNTAVAGLVAANTKVSDADKLDGIDSSGFARQEIIPTKTLKIGWYTIATNIGNRASAKFVLRETRSGRHQSIHFYAAHNYGNGNVITVLSNSWHSGGGAIKNLRIKEASTYDGAVLQAYIDTDDAPVSGFIFEDIQSSGWTPQTWIPDATAPKGIKDYTKLTNIAATINLDNTFGVNSSTDMFVKNYIVYHEGNKPKSINNFIDYGKTGVLHGYEEDGTIAKSNSKNYRKLLSTGLYSYRTYAGIVGSPAGYGAAVGFGDGAKGSVEIMGRWTGSGGELWTRSLRDCCQNWSEWQKMWTSGNDGSGSGLDADKLDGIESTGFVRKGIDAGHSWNGGYLIFNHATDGKNTDAISFNDSTNAFYFNADTVKTNTSANASIHAGDIHANGTGYYGDNKKIIQFSDTWLRLNPSSEFTSGIYCGTKILRTDGEFQVGGGGDKFKVDKNGNTTVYGNITGKSVDKKYSHLYKFGGIHFTWDSDTYGTNTQHAIRSTYGTSFGDSLTMNSFNHIRLNIDSNNNNANSRFEIGHNTSGTSNVIFSVDENGNTVAAGNITAFSDRRLKKALKPVTESFLNKIDQLKPTFYQWKDKAKQQTEQLGFIAQEVMEVFPQWVHKSNEHYAVSYDKMGAVLAVKGIQELHKEIKALKAELKNLKHGVTN